MNKGKLAPLSHLEMGEGEISIPRESCNILNNILLVFLPLMILFLYGKNFQLFYRQLLPFLAFSRIVFSNQRQFKEKTGLNQSWKGAKFTCLPTTEIHTRCARENIVWLSRKTRQSLLVCLVHLDCFCVYFQLPKDFSPFFVFRKLRMQKERKEGRESARKK